MKNFNINIAIFLFINSLGFSQIKPVMSPISNSKKINLIKHTYNEDLIQTSFPNNDFISQIEIDLLEKNNFRFEILIKDLKNEEKLFIIDENNNFYGPYTKIDANNEIITTDIIYSKNIIIELNSNSNIVDREISINVINYNKPN